MEGGLGDKAIIDLIGKSQGKMEMVYSKGPLESIYKENKIKEKAYKYFDNFHQFRDYGTLGSLHKKGKTDTKKYPVQGSKHSIAYSHAYTIVDTDPINKTVDIVNPWKLDDIFTLTYEQTCKAFNIISGIGVNFEKAFT